MKLNILKIRPFFGPFWENPAKIRPQIFPATYILIRPLLSFAAEESASWEHWPGAGGLAHRVHILIEMIQGQCICPLSWSVHCNFTGDGYSNERGWACTPHPHQPGLILPS
jgi:hypothetical protein